MHRYRLVAIAEVDSGVLKTGPEGEVAASVHLQNLQILFRHQAQMRRRPNSSVSRRRRPLRRCRRVDCETLPRRLLSPARQAVAAHHWYMPLPLGAFWR